MHHPSACRRSLPVAVNSAAVVARPVSVVVADAAAYYCPIIRWSVFVIGVRIAVVVVVTPRIIPSWIIAGLILGYVRALCTAAEQRCNSACADDGQQECSTASHGFGFCYRLHQIFPFSLNSDFPRRPRSLLGLIGAALYRAACFDLFAQFEGNRPHIKNRVASLLWP
jgi:hypothetical protein